MNKLPSEPELRHLRELIKKIDFCMLTTIGEDGSPHTRPMSNNREVEFDGDLWFFTYGETYKVLEISKDNHASVAFSSPSDGAFVVVGGLAELSRDKQKAAELWQPHLKAWFPKGVDEPDLALIKVNAKYAEIWEGPSNFFSRAIEFGMAIATGRTADGEHRRLDLSQTT